MCQLYLGDTNSYATTPPNQFWTNPSIQSPSYTFVADGTGYPINVVLQNADTNTGCSAALVELYWSDPTTSFLLVSGNAVPPTGAAVQPIAAKLTFSPDDASTTFPFTWTPDATVAGTNGGHVCLAAIASCTTTSDGCVAPAPSSPGSTAATGNAQVAIHNTQVNLPPPGPMKRIWPFFFGATNGGGIPGLTRLVARAYNPDNEADRIHLLNLAALPAVRAAYGRCLKFGTPAEVHLALGAESVVVPPAQKGRCGGRLGYTGAVTPELADHLVKRSWTKAVGHAPVTKEFDLISRQVQQAGVYVTPREEDGRIYAIEIGHELIAKGAPPTLLGGLTVLFAAPCRPW
jgi:hypothetical protein